jgi:hypothetical protein
MAEFQILQANSAVLVVPFLASSGTLALGFGGQK